MKISIVIPVYEGTKTIAKLTNELIKNLKYDDFEIILVNDGSKDNSHEECLNLFQKNKNIIRYICLMKNFGEHNAVIAGLNYSTGDYAVVIDDDFQNPPEEIHKLVNEAVSKNCDVVYSYYSKKHHSWFRNLGSSFTNFVANFLLNKPKNLYLSSFKCLSHTLVSEIIKYKGPFPYIDGLILRSTQNISKVLVKHAERKVGESGYTIRKLVGLWLNMFINFSISPLRVSTFLGFFFSFLGGIFSIYLIIDKFIHPEVPHGITSIMVAILVFSGIQLLILGLLGEYIGKLLLADNLTPQYVIRQICTNDKKEIKS